MDMCEGERRVSSASTTRSRARMTSEKMRTKKTEGKDVVGRSTRSRRTHRMPPGTVVLCTKHVKTTSRNFLPDERRFALRVNQTVVKLYHPVKF